ncbi:metallophosphoesterase [Paraflavisolibacter sp. H34]|uniref:metallophosphoesterase n=1 Tax=Huijunlia imazamoxiresistens TaxID=3127457 RepID=UPI0030175922
MTFVLGDIHGQYKALMQVLERSGLDYERDRLVFLGDVVDRGGAPFSCIRELMKIRDKVLIRGNHDQNFYQFIRTGVDAFMGANGVAITKKLWQELDAEDRRQAADFFRLQVPYYMDEERNLFTHGGFDPDVEVAKQEERVFAWDRSLWQLAVLRPEEKISGREQFNAIYIGHTPTLLWQQTTPMTCGGITNLDTGAGFAGGRLTLMNLRTGAYFQSDSIEL